MRQIILLLLTLLLADLCACAAKPAETKTVYADQPIHYSSYIEIDPETKPFSYAEDWETHGPGSDYPAWQDSGFKNTLPVTIETVEDVIDLARKECIFMHNRICVYRDEEAGMWMVLFSIKEELGGSQCVYIDDSGITQLVIFEE